MSDLNFSLLLPRADPLPRTIAARTRRIYDVVASVYPLSTLLFHSRTHECALRLSGIANGMRVLEVATGSGEMFHKLVDRNPDGTTVGLDLSPNMAAQALRRARKDYAQAEAACGAVDVRDLPFRSGSFDAVVCCYLLELLGEEDIHRTVSEIRRVLRPGGRLTLAVIAQNKPLFNRVYRLGGKLLPAFWGRQVEERAPEVLRRAGLRLVADQFVQQGYYPSRVLVAENAAARAVFAGN